MLAGEMLLIAAAKTILGFSAQLHVYIHIYTGSLYIYIYILHFNALT